ncbi:transposable element Tcb1 transposase [Trichonephila clavipes]|nr:transposable element Tcb1 transposase [Trichonephila clavipes]
MSIISYNHMCCHSCNHSFSHFQQDNARPHTARVSQDCIRTVSSFPWQAESPDLSAVEHYLLRRVGHPTSLNELEARLLQIRDEMSQDIIRNLYASMSDRIASCIRARGVQQGFKFSVLLPFYLK